MDEVLKIISDNKAILDRIDKLLTEAESCADNLVNDRQGLVKDLVKKPKEWVYIVTGWNSGEEPVISAFGNEEAAKRCLGYFNEKYEGACLDHMPVYQTFTEF